MIATSIFINLASSSVGSIFFKQYLKCLILKLLLSQKPSMYTKIQDVGIILIAKIKNFLQLPIFSKNFWKSIGYRFYDIYRENFVGEYFV